MFQLDPAVSDWSEDSTFLVCLAVQSYNDDILFQESAKQQLNIVFPPQVCSMHAYLNISKSELLAVTPELCCSWWKWWTPPPAA